MRYHMSGTRLLPILTGTALFLLIGSPNAHAQTFTGYSGNAYGTFIGATLVPVDVTLAATGNLPATGGTLSNSVVTASTSLTGLPLGAALTTGVENASTNGVGEQAFSSASVDNLALNLGGLLPVTIGAGVLTSNSLATVSGVDGSSVITGLEIDGLAVTVTGAPNQTVLLPLGLGSIVINEQITNFTPTLNEITTNALDITVTGVGQIIVSHAESDVAATGAVHATVPEPGASALLGSVGLVGAVFLRRRLAR